jgi:hypothetical protein
VRDFDHLTVSAWQFHRSIGQLKLAIGLSMYCVFRGGLGLCRTTGALLAFASLLQYH